MSIGIWCAVTPWSSHSAESIPPIFSISPPASSTPLAPLGRSGITFASPDIRQLQADNFANPGMLWVTRGETIWRTPSGVKGQACASCHQDAQQSMQGVSARYPRLDTGRGTILNIEGQINRCRQEQQATTPWVYESADLLAMTAYLNYQSRGMPIAVTIDTDNRTQWERGKAIFHRRQGQMNLACVHCHEQLVGRKLLTDTLSEGHGNAYPIYRLEWQTVGSLQRRLRSCFNGVRAAIPDYGAEELLALELYLAWRSSGLTVEAPGVRR